MPLSQAMDAWFRDAAMGDDDFASRYFGRGVNDPVVRNLHEAVQRAAVASNSAEWRAAADKFADALQVVGKDNLPRFAAEAQTRAEAASRPQQLAQNAQASVQSETSGKLDAEEKHGGYVVPDPMQWVGKPSQGDGQCVALIHAAIKIPRTSEWRFGMRVQDDPSPHIGQVIATHDENMRYGNHTDGTSHFAIWKRHHLSWS